jgi:hypothetical protein
VDTGQKSGNKGSYFCRFQMVLVLSFWKKANDLDIASFFVSNEEILLQVTRDLSNSRASVRSCSYSTLFAFLF